VHCNKGRGGEERGRVIGGKTDKERGKGVVTGHGRKKIIKDLRAFTGLGE